MKTQPNKALKHPGQRVRSDRRPNKTNPDRN
jgi:hypothetical protein